MSLTTDPLTPPDVAAANRLSYAFGPHGPLPLAAHRQRFPAPPQPVNRPQPRLIDEIKRSGLRGRGGAGFPAGVKMESVAAGRGRPVVVVNGTEGEPASGKDLALLTGAPHLVIDGAVTAAAAVGADTIHLCVDRHATGAVTNLHRAIEERAAAGEPDPAIEVVDTPPRFVAGEETGLVHFLNGGPAKPTLTPPRPYEKGVRGRPTLVNNAETIAHVAQIAAFGADWFRQCGTPGDPGSALVSLTGAVRMPGVYELELGTPLHQALDLAGGLTEEVQAYLVGGYFGVWLPAAWAGVPLERQTLGEVGASLGCGSIVALPASSCGWLETARVLNWMAGESAGQCGPCLHGLRSIADAAHDLAVGRGNRDTVANLNRWAGMVEGRGACKMPDGAVRFLRSALHAFTAEVRNHAQRRPCPSWQAPAVLPIPALGNPYDEWTFR